MIVNEVLTYFAYIYSFIIIAILIEPTVLSMLPIMLFWIASTLYILYTCKNLSKQMGNWRLLQIAINYSFLCISGFYLLSVFAKVSAHYTFKLLALALPLYYFIFIKAFDFVFSCGRFHTFKIAKHLYYSITIFNIIIIAFL